MAGNGFLLPILMPGINNDLVSVFPFIITINPIKSSGLIHDNLNIVVKNHRNFISF